MTIQRYTEKKKQPTIICEQAHQLGSTKENKMERNGIVEVTLAIIIVGFCYYYRFHRETMY